VGRLVAVTAAQVMADRDQARLDARAALTSRLHGLPWGPLAIEAARCSVPAALDEWTELTLTAVRLAAVALQADPADMLAALLTGRAAVEETAG
jgi:hypothetical protein